MEQELDFTKLPIGTVVFDNTRHGEGIIVDIYLNSHRKVFVRFNNGAAEFYTKDGRVDSNYPRILSTENYTMPQMKCEMPKKRLQRGDLVICKSTTGSKRIGIFDSYDTTYSVDEIAHVILDLNTNNPISYYLHEIEPYEK